MGGAWVRRISELIYTIAFFGCGLWALSSGVATLFSGLEDLTTAGTWASALMVIVSISLKVFGEVNRKNTKTLIFVGLTALFGGMWGIGTVLVILSGVLMITRGFKQVSILREQPSLKELRQIRKERLAEVEDEEVEYQEDNPTNSPSVAEELLEGFVGSDDHEREIRTWINQREFDKRDLSPDEVRARAKQEIRENKLSLETIIAMEELGLTSQEDEDIDLTNINLDLPTTEEDEQDEQVGDIEEKYIEDEQYIEDELEEQEPTQEDILGMSIEDLMGD